MLRLYTFGTLFALTVAAGVVLLLSFLATR